MSEWRRCHTPPNPHSNRLPAKHHTSFTLTPPFPSPVLSCCCARETRPPARLASRTASCACVLGQPVLRVPGSLLMSMGRCSARGSATQNNAGSNNRRSQLDAIPLLCRHGATSPLPARLSTHQPSHDPTLRAWRTNIYSKSYLGRLERLWGSYRPPNLGPERSRIHPRTLGKRRENNSE